MTEVEVLTLVTVAVVCEVAVVVEGLTVVSVTVLSWMGTNRVDCVMDVITEEMDTVVKSVTTVGISRVGRAPLTITWLRGLVGMVTALWIPAMAAEMLEGGATVGEAVMLCPSKLNMAEVMSAEEEALVRVFNDNRAEYRNNNNILGRNGYMRDGVCC